MTSSVHLECHVLDEECPDFVAESVRVEAPLRRSLVLIRDTAVVANPP